MGRSPCCDKSKVKRGTWSPEEDAKLISYLSEHGTTGNWIALPHKAGLRRCGKSCRLRWLNYLRPDIKHGAFTQEEDNTICSLYNTLGSRWSVIASQLPGRTDNDVKNYWNTKLKKKIIHSHSNPPTKTNIETATAASGSAAAATTTTTTSGEASFFQESMYSIGLVSERKSSVSSGTMSYNNFPRLMLEGATSSDNSCNLYPSQQDLDPFNRPFNECSSEVMSDIWCQEEGFGADSNADLFSIVFQNVSYND